MDYAMIPPAEPLAPTSSPWGPPQTTTRLAIGVWSIATASHGGIWLSPERNAQVPSYMADTAGWYEEDLAWAIAAVVHPQAFADDQVEAAFKILRICMPDAYERFTGRTVAPGESYVRDRAVFYRDNPGAWVVCIAWDDNAAWVEQGHFGVAARQGKPGTDAYVASAERYFMIPSAEYQANPGVVGFHIDPARHREVAAPQDANAKSVAA